jgi:hypothetical protein
VGVIAVAQPVTVSDVVALAAMINAIGGTGNVRVRRVVEGGDVVEGVIRRLVTSPDRPVTPGPLDDVRECYVHVTAVFEFFWPVRELITEYHERLFVIG